MITLNSPDSGLFGYNQIGDIMKEEIEKLDEMIKKFQDMMKSIYYLYQNDKLAREVVLSAMIIKKTIDILAVSKYAIKNYIVTVQISLLRLLCDNCLALESVNELGIVKYMDMINNNEQVNQIMVTEDQNMSDGYLKRKVSENYKGFDRVYKFACEGVHFSKQAIGGAFTETENGIALNIEPGNKELKETIKSNNNCMITVCKVIIDMLTSIVRKQK